MELVSEPTTEDDSACERGNESGVASKVGPASSEVELSCRSCGPHGTVVLGFSSS